MLLKKKTEKGNWVGRTLFRLQDQKSFSQAKLSYRNGLVIIPTTCSVTKSRLEKAWPKHRHSSGSKSMAAGLLVNYASSR